MFLTVQKMRLLEPLQRSEEYSSLCNHVTSTSEMFGSSFGDLSSLTSEMFGSSLWFLKAWL
jgi:hypothetical protein